MQRQARKATKRVGANRRRRWLATGSIMALGGALAALAAQPAAAQIVTSPGVAVNASATYDASEITYSASDTNDTVTVRTPQAIINWNTRVSGAPNTTVSFLDAGKGLTFTSGLNDYVVLNRIFTSAASGIDSPVRIDGNITSSTNFGSSAGGRVWFYSPGGLILGSQSVFNVGSLVVSSSNLSSIDAGGTQLNFNGTPVSGSKVVVEPGAQIFAVTNGSYVAMVGPRVEQGGTVDVNGSVAYVGAERAQLTITNGLFDIAIGLGTSDPNGVVHTGTTTGDASSATITGLGQVTDADAQGIFMVAVPKNTALQMLVGGNIGYRQAAVASVTPNGTIVLSAGSDVAIGGGAADPTIALTPNTTTTAGASIRLPGGFFSADVNAAATDAIDVTPGAFGFVQNGVRANGTGYAFTARAGNRITVDAGSTGSVSLAGDTTLTAGQGPTGGTVRLAAQGNGGQGSGSGGGVLYFGGDLLVDASGNGAEDAQGASPGQNAVGGAILVDLAGGTMNVVGRATFDAHAAPGVTPIGAGSATGGSVDINLNGPTALFSAPSVTIATDARAASQASQIVPAAGSDGRGGNAAVRVIGGSFSTQQLTINTNGVASPGSADPVTGRFAQSGNASLEARSGGLLEATNLFVTQQAISAGAADTNQIYHDGTASEGTFAVLADGGTVRIGASGTVDVRIEGNRASPAIGGATFIVDNGGLIDLPGVFALEVGAYGGNADQDQTAGNILVDIRNGTFNTSTTTLDSIAFRNSVYGVDPNNFTAGLQQGGRVDLAVGALGTLSGTNLFLGSRAGSDINRSRALGGTVTLTFDGNANLTGTLGFTSDGQGGYTGRGVTGQGTGGTAMLTVRNKANVSVGTLNGSANGRVFACFNAECNVASEGDGGPGAGGTIMLNMEGGTLTANTINVAANGYGASGASVPNIPGADAAAGGTGQGGTIAFNLTGGAITANTLTVAADGLGGNGGLGDARQGTTAGRGGDGVGGSALFTASGGTLNAGTLRVQALGNQAPSPQQASPYANGGAGLGVDGGRGGNGIGGTARFDLDGTSAITAGSVVVDTSAYGGTGGSTFDRVNFFVQPPLVFPAGTPGSGGDATGGQAVFNSTAGTISFQGLLVAANALGGNGGTQFRVAGETFGNGASGGNATGGTALLTLFQPENGRAGYAVSADATGGDGSSGFAGGDGGSATGGTAQLGIDGVTATLLAPVMSASADGGRGGDSVYDPTRGAAGAGGAGGNAQGGTARLQTSTSGATVDVDQGFEFRADALGGDGGIGASTPGAGSGEVAGNGGAGGAGIGGTTEIRANSGTTITIINQFTSTSGGPLLLASNGTGGTGGNGGSLGSAAVGTPGNGGNGGAGTGGAPTLLAVGGTIAGAAVDFAATGQGGDGGAAGTGAVGSQPAPVAGTGGLGTGGTPTIETRNGSPGIITLGSVTMTADGFGGTGRFFGGNFGGEIRLIDGSADPAGLITLDSLIATAFGSYVAGMPGFTAKSASGPITITNGLTVDVAGDVRLDFANDGQIVVGGNADIFSGGNVISNHANPGATRSLQVGGDLLVEALGDISVAGNVSAAQYVEARARSIRFGNVTAGTDVILSSFNGGLTVGDVTAGDDIFLTVNGSNANKATVSPDSQTGQVSATQFALVAGNLRSTGQGSDTAASGPHTFTGAGPTGNVVRVRASGAVQIGNLDTPGTAILASDLATITTQAITAPGGIALFVRGNATTGNLTTSGTFWLGNSTQYFLAVPSYQVSNYPFFQTPTAGGATLGTVSAGLIRGSVLGDTTYASLTAASDVLWTTGNATTIGGSVTGGAIRAGATLTVRAGGGVTFTDATAGSNVLLTGSTGSITGDSITGDNVDAGAGIDLAVARIVSRGDANLGASTGNMTFDTISSGGRINAGAGGTVTGGSATAASTISFAAGGTIDLAKVAGTDATLTSTDGAVRVNQDAALTGSIDARGKSVFVRSLGNLTATALASAGDVEIISNGNLVAGGGTSSTAISASGNIRLTSTQQKVTVLGARAGVTGGGGSLPPGTQGPLGTIVASGAGDILVNAATDILIQGDTVATGNLIMNAGRLVDVRALATGAQIGVTSADITIADGTSAAGPTTGAIGQSGSTTLVEFTSRNGAMYLGGAGGKTTGYELSNAEFARVHSRGNLAFFAQGQSTAGGKVTIDTLGVVAGTSGNMGAGGTLAVSSNAIDVIGAVTVTGASGDLALNLAATGDVFLHAPDGLLSITDGNGAYTGSIVIKAADFYAMTDAARADIGALTTMAAIDGRLAKSDGMDIADGLIRTGTLDITTVASDVLIQNTAPGTKFADRRGFTVTTLLIADSANTVQPIVINGVIDGNTGLKAVPLAEISSTYDPGSTINGCLIANVASCREDSFEDPVQDKIVDQQTYNPLPGAIESTLIDLRPDFDREPDPLIDDPVTGAGNEDLWTGEEGSCSDDGGEACPAPQ